jgi:ATP-dependent RNA helicase DDX24/MAK5
MQQRQRLKKLEQFYNKSCSIIVCTDVASRGLDIPEVQNVIHYQIPREMDTYVHRSGRTARIGKSGVAYALIGPGDKKNYLNICRYLNREQGIQDIQLSLKEIEQLKEYTILADKMEKGEFQIKKKKKETEWFANNAKKADITLDDEIENEMWKMEDEVTSKKKVLMNDRRSYTKAQNKMEKFSDEHRRRSVFLDPSRIAELNALYSKAQANPEVFAKKKGKTFKEPETKHKYKKRKF